MRQTGGQRVVAWLVAGLVFAWALPSWAQSWSYRRETDEMTDRTNHFASVRVGSGFRPAVFFAACRNDDLEMWLAPNDYIGSSDDNGPETSRDDSRIYIDYRVNDEPAQEGRLANLSTDEDAFFFQDHADIIRGLIGKRLIVKWRDYRGTSTTLTIPTRGAAAALKKLPCARPYIPNCGDGELQPGEECDEGRKNSNGRGAVCRRDCTYAPAVCGDGAVQHDEVCDSGIKAEEDAEIICGSTCTLAPVYAELLVPCGVGSSTILIDNVQVGVCGETIRRIRPGRHTVIRRREGTGDLSADVDFEAGQRASLPLLPALLSLTVSAADAEIFINGVSIGRSVGSGTRFEVAPGLKQLQVTKSGYVTFATGLSLSPGVERSLVVTLKPLEPLAPVAPVAPPIPAATPVSL